MAFAPGWPGTEMPYSVSMPITRRALIPQSLMPSPVTTARRARRVTSSCRLQVLTGVSHGVNGTACLSPALTGDEGTDVDDPLALLAGDAGPVVRVSGVRQVLVLLELVHARGQQMRDPQALLPGLQELLDRHLLRPVDDVLDHRTGVEVAEVEHFLVAVGVGDLEEPVLLGLGVHPLDHELDHLGD